MGDRELSGERFAARFEIDRTGKAAQFGIELRRFRCFGDEFGERFRGHRRRLRRGSSFVGGLGIAFDRRLGFGRQLRRFTRHRRIRARQDDGGKIGVGSKIACKAGFRQKQHGGGSHADGSHAGYVQNATHIVRQKCGR
jgi:hypothetical protein